MKKNFRFLLALVLAALLLAALAVPAMAEGYKLTIKHDDSITDAKDHVYKAYQILIGDISGSEGSYVLSNMKWGSNAMSGKTINQALTPEEIATVKAWTAADVKALVPTGEAANTATKNGTNYEFTDLAAGYYLVKDETTWAATDKDDASSAIIVQVVGDTSVTTKRSIPTGDKTVSDDEDSGTADNLTTSPKTTSSASGNNYESADHALYEEYTYTLKATLPNDNDLDEYSTYKLVFNDSMTKGISFLGDVTVTATNLKENATIAYTLSDNVKSATSANPVAADPLAWSLTIADLKQYVTTLKGTVVTVTYKAYLNKDAVVSSVASGTSTSSNDNTFTLEYSNKPGSEGTGKTTPDTVYTFTYDMPNIKKSEDKQGNQAVLADAGFTVKQGGTALKFVPVTADGTVVTEGVTEGSSTTKPVTPESVKAYRLAKEGETGAITVIGSLSDGTFKLLGLDAGTYTLSETYTPSGYNTCPDSTIVITGNTEETTTGTGAKATMTMTQDNKASTENTFINKQGATLPSTGGIGTTIFYIGGSILVLAAVILLITKRRMGAGE